MDVFILLRRMAFFLQTVPASVAPRACTEGRVLHVDPGLVAGSGVTLSLHEVQDVREHHQQGQQDADSERGLGRENRKAGQNVRLSKHRKKL